MNASRIRWLAAFLASITLPACATFPVNPPLGQIDPGSGYRVANLPPGEGNSEETLLILSLSGGGTRAAALSFGVMKALRAARLPNGHSLLDETDVITAVSGSSLTAAYFGVYGEEKFFRDFPDEVLYRNLERGLLLRTLSPWHWPRLWSPWYSRSDLAQEYLDARIFKGHTFADMRPQRPGIILNATDMTLGAQFSFNQGAFDILCSDLSQLPVSRAVTASLAFSGAFAPVTLKNYPKENCGYERPAWVDPALADDLENDPRLYDRAQNLVAYENAERRPYIHLLDGGVSDNIGLRAPKIAFLVRDAPWSVVGRIEDGTIRRIIVIVVDARTAELLQHDQKASPPGLVSVLVATSGKPMSNYSSETIQVVKDHLADLSNRAAEYRRLRLACRQLTEEECRAGGECGDEKAERCYQRFGVEDEAQPPDPAIYFIHLRFDILDDEVLRERLRKIPTTLALPRADVDLLVQSAPLLLREDQDYRKLLQDLQLRDDGT
jgi:predicted acylesterase/phospholipase RssA